MKKYLLPLLASFMLIFTACSNNANTDEQAKVEEDTTEQTVASEGEVFKIGAIPDFDQAEMEEAFDDFAQYLSNEIGIPVEFVPTVDYAH